MSIRSIVLLRPATSSGAENRDKRFAGGKSGGTFSRSSALPSASSQHGSLGGGSKAVELNTLRKIARAEPISDRLARSSADVEDLEQKWKSQELFPLGDVYLDLYGHAVMDAEKSKKTLQLRELSVAEQKTAKAFERVELRRHRKRFTVVRPLMGETADALERPQTVSLPTRKYRGKRGRLGEGASELCRARADSLSIYLLIRLSIFLSIYLSIYLSTYLSVYPIYLSFYHSPPPPTHTLQNQKETKNLALAPRLEGVPCVSSERLGLRDCSCRRLVRVRERQTSTRTHQRSRSHLLIIEPRLRRAPLVLERPYASTAHSLTPKVQSQSAVSVRQRTCTGVTRSVWMGDRRGGRGHSDESGRRVER